MSFYKLLKPLIFKLESEKAHNLAIDFLKYFPNLATAFSLNEKRENLCQNICGFEFENPVGMSAGFDKNAQIVKALHKFGFGFVEAGTVTPMPQAGNDKPRIFRLEKDEAIINRLGFNNKGAEFFAKNIENLNLSIAQSGTESGAKNNKKKIILGVNIGKNKDTQSALDDYLFLLEKFYEKASYITLNVSSPNTKNLRDLQDEKQLDGFLSEIMSLKDQLKIVHKKETPIWLKLAPDLTWKQQEKIAEIALQNKISALIISNTTIDRPESLLSFNKKEQGGLSGKPLFKQSNEVLKNFYSLTNGQIPLIGVGGISSANDVYAKIKLGASLVQIYSTLIYQGFEAVEKINKELSQLIRRDGFENISQAIGFENRG